MARVLRELGAETTLVIAHGLASDALYGDFDAIDVVEKVGDVSGVRVAAAAAAEQVASLGDEALDTRLGEMLPLRVDAEAAADA